MHKHVRPPEEPSVLQDARGRGARWEDFSHEEKQAVQAVLLEIQNRRCAYCERALREGKGHIEHFRKRALYPNKTFEWKNLFYSCCEETSCGKRKDNAVRIREDNERLIDPCEENPEDFFVFDDRGQIAVRSTVSGGDRQRAEFTIRAFGLNGPRLVQARRDNLKQYEWLEQYPDQVQEYLSAIASVPFITSIYHCFGQRRVP